MFARGYFPGRSGQVFVVPKEGAFVTSHDPLYQFMHGSPWEYDTHIPLLLYGAPFVKTGRFTGAAKQQDVAPTVGALIGGNLGGRLAGKIKPSTLRWTVVTIGVIVAIIYFVR